MAAASSSGQGRSASASKALAVDLAALFAELAATPAASEGVTTAELREQYGWSVPKARGFIQAALKHGKASVVRKQIMAMDGRLTSVSAYVFA